MNFLEKYSITLIISPVWKFVSAKKVFKSIVVDYLAALESVQYILSFISDKNQEYIFVRVLNDTIKDDIRIFTIESKATDFGVLLWEQGINNYHKCCHLNRDRDFSESHLRKIEFLTDKDTPLDIDLIQIYKFGFGDLETIKIGVYKILEIQKHETFFPMHSGGAEYCYRQFTERSIADIVDTPINCF